jgi:ChrR-like protein with cupin domain
MIGKLGLIAAGILFSLAHVASADPMMKSGPVPTGDVKWAPLVPQLGAKGPQFTVVFGNPQTGPAGMILRLPAGFNSGPHTHSSDYQGIVISGDFVDTEPGQAAKAERMTPGTQWFEAANRPHENLCASKTECVIFAYFPKAVDTKPWKK